jgi:DNA-binding transcriptional LysR family regulator
MNVISRAFLSDCNPILDKIDFKRLRYFTAVADAGSFSRAAERLGMAQPHLSRQIMRLEAALGHRLFVRRARHIELTDAGVILRQEASFIALKLDSLQERMNEARTGSTGSLCIGFSGTECSSSLVAQIVESVGRKEPQLSLDFSVDSPSRLIEAVVDRRVQACFLRSPAVTATELRIDHLGSEPILLAVHRRHRLSGRDQIEIAELAAERFILCERNQAPETYDQIVTACENGGFSPRVSFHAPQLSCAMMLAAAGIGATFVPASHQSTFTQGLRFLSMAGDSFDTNLALITRTDEHMASVRLLRKHALALANSERTSKRDFSPRVVAVQS